MWFKHSMSIAQQLMPIYNTTLHKNKITVALNMANVPAISYKTPNMPQGGRVANSKNVNKVSDSLVVNKKSLFL